MAVAVGLIFAAVLVALGVGAGWRQFATRRRLREEVYMPDVDQRYFRGQVRRRLCASGLLVVIGAMIGVYYLAGWDARMDEVGAKGEGNPPTEDDKDFARFIGGYWIVVILLLGAVVLVAILDFWATRVYWLARYREIKSDHDAKLQRDLAVFRQRKLNERVPGLGKRVDDDTPPEGHKPVE